MAMRLALNTEGWMNSALMSGDQQMQHLRWILGPKSISATLRHEKMVKFSWEIFFCNFTWLCKRNWCFRRLQSVTRELTTWLLNIRRIIALNHRVNLEIFRNTLTLRLPSPKLSALLQTLTQPNKMSTTSRQSSFGGKFKNIFYHVL